MWLRSDYSVYGAIPSAQVSAESVEGLNGNIDHFRKEVSFPPRLRSRENKDGDKDSSAAYIFGY